MTVIEQRACEAQILTAKKLAELAAPKPVDWERRRYEIAGACIAQIAGAVVSGIIMHDDTPSAEEYAQCASAAARRAVAYADALIAELKKTDKI